MEAFSSEAFISRRDYDTEAFAPFRSSYHFIADYASDHHLINTSIALPLIRSLFLAPADVRVAFRRDEKARVSYFNHALSICQMLIDLDIPFSTEETDIALSAALCHIMIELLDLPNAGQELVEDYHLDPRVLSTIRLITREGTPTAAQQRAFYERIQQDKIAVVVRLADRGNLVSILHTISILEAQSYVQETRAYFFPMCIYAKEHYPELTLVISILMEKMRGLIEITDILITRFREHETALTKEILELKEENSRIRGIINKLKAEA